MVLVVWECEVEIKFLEKLDTDEEIEVEFFEDEDGLGGLLDDIEKGLSDGESQT